MSENELKKPRIQALARADAILSIVMSAANGVAALPDLTVESGLNKTTVFTLAESLVALGYLQRSNKPKGYRLGLRNLELGRGLARRLGILEVARPALQRLCEQTGETVNLAQPYVTDALIVEALESDHAVRAMSYAGTRASYHSTACGKAMLAHFDPGHRRQIYDATGLPARTERTITDVAVLERDLAECLERGYAVEREENEIGAYCIGMAILGPFDEVVGSISVSGLLQRMNEKMVADTVNLLRTEIDALAGELSGA